MRVIIFAKEAKFHDMYHQREAEMTKVDNLNFRVGTLNPAGPCTCSCYRDGQTSMIQGDADPTGCGCGCSSQSGKQNWLSQVDQYPPAGF